MAAEERHKSPSKLGRAGEERQKVPLGVALGVCSIGSESLTLPVTLVKVPWKGAFSLAEAERAELELLGLHSWSLNAFRVFRQITPQSPTQHITRLLIWIGATQMTLQSRCGNRTALGYAGVVRRSKVEAASRATASRPALGTATISRGRRMRRQHSASCRCGEPPRSIGISARPLGHAADADEPPDGSWVAALPPWTSWSAHAPGDTLLASKCDGDLTLLRVASSRVVLLGAPLSGCACLRRPPSSCAGPQWPRVAVARGRQLPGTRRGATGGSLPP